MKANIIIGFSMIVIFFGCSHTSNVRTDSTRFVELQRQAKNKQADVTLRDSQYYLNAQLVQLTPDSTSWVLQNGEVMNVPTREISEIRFVNRSKGALEGLGLGLLGGVLTGAVIGLAGGEGAIFSKEEAAIVGAVYFGGIGGLLGIPIGAAVGSKSKYQFQVPKKLATERVPIAMTKENMKLWKESILSLLTVDSKVHKKWKEHAKFNKLNNDTDIWVNSLHESDFQDFAGSGKRLRDWLLIRFSERPPAAEN